MTRRALPTNPRHSARRASHGPAQREPFCGLLRRTNGPRLLSAAQVWTYVWGLLPLRPPLLIPRVGVFALGQRSKPSQLPVYPRRTLHDTSHTDHLLLECPAATSEPARAKRNTTGRSAHHVAGSVRFANPREWPPPLGAFPPFRQDRGRRPTVASGWGWLVIRSAEMSATRAYPGARWGGSAGAWEPLTLHATLRPPLVPIKGAPSRRDHLRPPLTRPLRGSRAPLSGRCSSWSASDVRRVQASPHGSDPPLPGVEWHTHSHWGHGRQAGDVPSCGPPLASPPGAGWRSQIDLPEVWPDRVRPRRRA